MEGMGAPPPQYVSTTRGSQGSVLLPSPSSASAAPGPVFQESQANNTHHLSHFSGGFNPNILTAGDLSIVFDGSPELHRVHISGTA
jgi:hypothetical protein